MSNSICDNSIFLILLPGDALVFPQENGILLVELQEDGRLLFAALSCESLDEFLVDIAIIEGEEKGPCDCCLHALWIDFLNLLHQESHVAGQVVHQATITLYFLHDLASGKGTSPFAIGRGGLALCLPVVALGVESPAGIEHADWLIILRVERLLEFRGGLGYVVV